MVVYKYGSKGKKDDDDEEREGNAAAADGENNKDAAAADDDDDDDEIGEQIRVSLTLAKDCKDRTLEVPSGAIAVPAAVGRRGLSAVVNHLLGRRVTKEEDDGDDDDDDDSSKDDDDDDDKEKDLPPALNFEFALRHGTTAAGSNRLLRTGVEREARKKGVSLERAVEITYFPAQEAPEPSGRSESLPDWISCISHVASSEESENGSGLLCTATYDGSIQIFRPARATKGGDQDPGGISLALLSERKHAHAGPIKCMDAVSTAADTLWVATGSMDHSLLLHRFDSGRSSGDDDGDGGDENKNRLEAFAACTEGHGSSVGSVDIFAPPGGDGQRRLLASGDWDGGLCIWDFGTDSVAEEDPIEEGEEEGASSSRKRIKTGSDSRNSNNGSATPTTVGIRPKISIRAHSSQISGVAWGNYEKARSGQNNNTTNNAGGGNSLITCSWDHSIKVWDVERRDCLMTLNGSRVNSCMDTSHHSPGIVATGHPDCTVRLWDVRTTTRGKHQDGSSLSVSDNTFKPSHRAWVSSVRWSRRNAYHLASVSHDGTVKLWDIRSPLPLHTVRAFRKADKGLCLTLGYDADADADGLIFAGGTDCVVKQFRTNGVL